MVDDRAMKARVVGVDDEGTGVAVVDAEGASLLGSGVVGGIFLGAMGGVSSVDGACVAVVGVEEARV